MEGSIWKSMAYYCLGVLILYNVLRVVYSIWWRPKRLEKQLRKQGIRGTSYKLFWGDVNVIKQSHMAARSKPMALNHSIVPRVSPFNYEMAQKYGKVSVSWHFTRPRVLIMDPELIRMILTVNNDHFIRSPGNPLVEILTKGLSYLQGEKWVKRRKLLTPAFHFEKLKGMVPAFSVSCQNLIERWKNLVGPQGTNELDVMPEMQNLTADIISRAAFGSNYEEGKEVFELQKEQAVLVMEAALTFYIPGLRCRYLKCWSFGIWWTNDPNFCTFVPTRKNKKRYHVHNEINTMLKKMILKRKQTMKDKGDSGNDDLLGLLLQCQEQADSKMTIEDVIEECKLFHFAGQETTANWLTWTIIVLSMHPNWQDKAREEVLQICGKKMPDIEAINHLKIVSMILHEVLRLYPPVVHQFRHTSKTINIEAGMCIPAGVDLVLSTLLLHHSDEYWGDDVEEFKPERFSEGVSNASMRDEIAFYPFGWGNRICLGQGFAMIEAKMALAMILQHFWFELSPTYTHAPHSVVTLRPQHGAPIILHQI